LYIAPDEILQVGGTGVCDLLDSLGRANNDIHIPIVSDPTFSEFDSFVVEPIPFRIAAAA